MHILIAEDDERMIESYETLLGEHDLIIVSDGEDALGQLEQKKFDLVIMDIVMPNMNGLEALALMSARGLDTPTIVATSTAYTNPQEHYDISYEFIKAFLQKPFTTDDLRNAIQKAVDQPEE